MITWIKTWVNQIIVATIIATILEMILPEGNNKKYIKMIIGIYLIFTIFNPVIAKITGNNISIANLNYDKYFNNTMENNISTSESFDKNNSKMIEQTYIDNVKNNIKTKVEQKGYKIININIGIIGNVNSDQYGKISNLKLELIKKIETEEENQVNSTDIEKVEININNNIQNNNKGEKLNNSEKQEIIKFLSEEYSINQKDIEIN